MAIVVVVLVSALAALDVWRVARRATLSRAGLLVAAAARAAMPAAVAVAIASWAEIAAFNGVATSGSGGLVVAATAAGRLLRTLQTGLIGCAVVLGVALILAARQRDAAGGASGGRGRRAAALIGTLAVVGSMGAVWGAVATSERVSVGILGPMLRGGTLPGATPNPAMASAPAAYAPYLTMSGQESARESEGLLTSRVIGVAVTLLLIVVSLATPGLFASVRAAGPAWAIGRSTVAALAIGAIWCSVRLGAGAGWLRAVIDR